LPDTKISNGEKVQGNVTFKLPEPVPDFTLQYTGPGKYNINWIQSVEEPT